MTRDNLRPRDPPMSRAGWCAHTPTRVIFAFALFCLSIAWLAWR